MPTPPGYPASFASFAFRLDCPPSLPTTSVDQNAKAYSHPHSSSLPFHTNRALIWPFHHMGGKDNPPPSVIYIVHQHNCMICVARDERSKRPPTWRRTRWVLCPLKCIPGKRPKRCIVCWMSQMSPLRC